MDPLLKLLPRPVLIHGSRLCQLAAVIPDLFKLVIISDVSVIGNQPSPHLFLLIRGRFAEEVFYQQLMVNMFKFFFQGITVLIVLVAVAKNQPVWFLIISMPCPYGFPLFLQKFPVSLRSLYTSFLQSGLIEKRCGIVQAIHSALP